MVCIRTNNWADYGGMDVYVKQITGSANHDLFYTNANVVVSSDTPLQNISNNNGHVRQSAFKSYIRTFVGRYKDEPTIMAWELANEPRCKGSTGYVFFLCPRRRILSQWNDRTTSGSCTTKTITNWATDISAFIKSIDSNHLVAIGDEGFYNQPSNPSYPYQCVLSTTTITMNGSTDMY